jgi:hypothetical protein
MLFIYVLNFWEVGLETTAQNTYWEADLFTDGVNVVERGKGLFGGCRFFLVLQSVRESKH